MNIFVATFALFASAAPLVTQAQPTELAEFEAIVARCREAYASRGLEEVVFAEAAKSWVKRVYAPASIAYDVRKTDSLVSPLVGHIEISQAVAAERAADEAAASALVVPIDGRSTRRTFRINFAHQGGKWSATTAIGMSASKDRAGAPYGRTMSYQENVGELARSKSPIAHCF